MIETTYRCDGCGTSTSAQQAADWKTVLPVGVEVHLRASSPLQSQFCGVCWRRAIEAVHAHTLDPSPGPALPVPTQFIDMRPAGRVATAEMSAQRPSLTR